MLITRNRLILFFICIIPVVILFYSFSNNDVEEFKYEKISLAYSPYRTSQDLNNVTLPTFQDIREDIELISLLSDHIRTYTSIEYVGTVVSLANEFDISVDVGLNITNNEEQNHKEVGSLLYLLENYENIRAVIIGNDYLHNNSVDKQIIIDTIYEVRSKISSDIKISTSNPASTWWEENDELIKNVDFVSINSYPYWQGVEINESMDLFYDEYETTNLKLSEKNYTKQVIVGETNWPSNGKIICDAIPNPENQLEYLSKVLQLSQNENIEVFVFEVFDEKWKNDESVPELPLIMEHCSVGSENDLHTERYWGLFNAERKLKDHLKPLIANIAGYTPQSNIHKNFFGTDVIVDIVLDEIHPKNNYVLFVDIKPLIQNSKQSITLQINKDDVSSFDVNLPKILKIPLTEDFSNISLVIHNLNDIELDVISYVLPSPLEECEYENNCLDLLPKSIASHD